MSVNSSYPRNIAAAHIMTNPRNCIEDFSPEAFAMRRPRNYTQHHITHENEIQRLTEIRHDLRRYGHLSCRVLGNLGSLFTTYMLSIRNSLDNIQAWHQLELKAIDETMAAQHAEIDASHSCHTSLAYFRAKMDARSTKRDLRKGTHELLKYRKDQLINAKDMMHRQLAINAYLTSELSWNGSRYRVNGVRQGHFKNTTMLPCHLTKNTEETKDGFYQLRLTWVPAHDATKYPAMLCIHRIGDERFALQEIIWADLAEYEDGLDLDHPFRLSTITVFAQICCNWVAHDQSMERAAKERAEMAEARYKRSLPPWKRLAYKTGDYQKALATTSSSASSSQAINN
ncbi:hypothetical protein MY11210_004631 [Beauveria gryllotalpidicola]